MTFDAQTLTPIAAALVALWGLRGIVRRFYVSAQPDEWLLSVRDERGGDGREGLCVERHGLLLRVVAAVSSAGPARSAAAS